MESEYEVRLLGVNIQEFIKLLQDYDALFIGNWIQKRYVYDFNPKIENKWIRLRTNGVETTLCIKDYTGINVGDTKELEIKVSDFDKTDLILVELGYEKRSVQINKRIRYMIDDVEVDIDTWPKLDTYVEFEATCEDDIIKLFNKLGLDYSKVTTMDAFDIYMSLGYREEDLNNLDFKEGNNEI